MNKIFPVRALGSFLWLLGALLFFPVITAGAHTLSTAYLTINSSPTSLTGELHLALRDLEDAVGLDENDDGVITWGELLARKDAVSAYALSRLHIKGDGRPGTLQISELLTDNHSDGAYAVLRFKVQGFPHPGRLEINYNALFDIDPKHCALLRLEDNGNTRLAVFGPATSSQVFDLTQAAPRPSFFTFLAQGVWHIGSGYDHFLFLIALLLPGVLLRRNGKWQPVSTPQQAFTNVFKIVTAFTIAHSITLSLAALGFVHLPTRLVESAIAATVVLAAFNNLVPFFSERGWAVAFGFGLLHGFGFANALVDLGLHGSQLAAALFGFNVGVELGQLAIAAALLPLALGLRQQWVYEHLVLRAGSVAIMVVAAGWLAERVFDFKWLPF